MASAKVVLTLLFTLTLGAGLVTGMLFARAPLASATTRPLARTPLSAELGLTSDQASRMHDIWEGVRDQVDDCFHRAQQAQQRRDAALLSLLTPDQKAAFAKSLQDYTDTVNTLKTDRGALLYVQSHGVRHGRPDVLARLAAGEDVDPSEYTFRTAVTIETSAPDLAWLNDGVFVAVGARQPTGVSYDVYLVE